MFEVSRSKINQIRARGLRDLHKRDPSSQLTVTRIEKCVSEMINIICWLLVGFLSLYLFYSNNNNNNNNIETFYSIRLSYFK